MPAELPLIEPETAAGATEALFAATQQMCGVTPNLIKAMANSPAALRGYVELAGALREDTLPEAIRARIAILIAQETHCDYGLSAWTFLATKVNGLSAAEAAAARTGAADDPKATALLAFAAALVRGHGTVGTADLAVAKNTLAPAEIVDVIAHVALNLFSNYLALAGQLANDWPLVPHDGPITH